MPVFWNRSDVGNDLSVMTPGISYSIWSSNAGTSGIATWSEPVILWSTSCSGSETMICGTVDSMSKDLISEDGIVRDASGCEMVGQSLQDLEQVVKVFVSVLNDNLEWSKQFGGNQVSLLFTSEMLDWHLDSSWFIGSVACWNSMVSEWDTTEEELSPIKFEASVDVRLNLLIVPGDDWPNSQILKISLGGLSSHLVKEIGLFPVLVHEHYGLGGTFLARVSVCIVVTLPGDVINIALSLWHVWTQDLPIVATILKPNSSIELLHEVLADL